MVVMTGAIDRRTENVRERQCIKTTGRTGWLLVLRVERTTPVTKTFYSVAYANGTVNLIRTHFVYFQSKRIAESE